MDLSKIIKDMKKSGFNGALIGSDIGQGDIIPFRNKALNLITEGGLTFGHVHEFFGLSQTGKCVGGETLISTKEGLIPIEDLFVPYIDSKSQTRTIPIHSMLEPERWYRLKKPISVLNSEGVFEETSRVYYGGKEPILALYTRYGFHITGTEDHKIQVMNRITKELEFLSLETIRRSKSDYTIPISVGAKIYGTNLKLVPSTDEKLPTMLTEEIAYDLGVLATSLYISTYFGPKAVKYKRPEYVRLAERWRKRGYKIESYNKNFIKWLLQNEIIVSNTATTEMPFSIKQAPREIVLAYIIGVLSKSIVTKKGILKFKHHSYHLVTQIHSFLANEGILTEMLFDTRHGFNSISINPSDLGSLKDIILKYVDPSIPLYQEVIKVREKELVNKIIYDNIKKIRKSKLDHPVYDIEVPTVHAYTANGIISHNSYFMYESLAQSQKIFNPTVGIIVDREGAYSPERGAQIGIDNSMTIVSRPADTPLPNHAVDFIEKAVQNIRADSKDTHIVILLDSLAAFDKDVKRESQDMGKGAMGWHNAFRDLLNLIDDKTVLLYSNHVTFKPVAFGPNKTKAGGEAGNYYRSCGIALERRGHIIDDKRNKEVLGDNLLVIVDKTRRGPSLRKLILPYYYATGVTEYAGYLWLLALRGYISPKNKDDFKKGLSKQYIYTKDGQTFNLLEGQEPLILKKFNELSFDHFPEYKDSETDDKDQGE